MTENELIALWNDKRRQLISAQLHSVITLAVITVMALMGFLNLPRTSQSFLPC